jgi:hypothetical protein
LILADFIQQYQNKPRQQLLKSKLGGLDLSRHRKKVSLDVMDNLDGFQKLVSTIEISRSRSRNLDFVSTRPKSPKSLKSLDRDREICRDMTFLANLDSFSRSRSRVSQCYHSSRSRFLNLSRFLSLKSQKSLQKVSIMSRNLDKSRKSRFVSTILICLDDLDLSRRSR